MGRELVSWKVCVHETCTLLENLEPWNQTLDPTTDAHLEGGGYCSKEWRSLTSYCLSYLLTWLVVLKTWFYLFLILCDLSILTSRSLNHCQTIFSLILINYRVPISTSCLDFPWFWFRPKISFHNFSMERVGWAFIYCFVLIDNGCPERGVFFDHQKLGPVSRASKPRSPAKNS